MIKHLYEIFAEKWYHGGSVYVYSDPHFSDLDCYRLRFPEDNIGAYGEKLDYIMAKDQMQIDNINKKVHKNDTLIILGDVGNVECVKKLKAGRKILIMGNHDAGRSNYERVITEVEHSSDTCPICGGSVTYDALTAYNCGPGYAYCDNCGTVKPKDNSYKDNHLFDEVYEGELTAGPKLKFSHEPLEHSDFCLNIHGHNHTSYQDEDNLHFNAIAECLNYSPIRLEEILNKKLLKNVPDIHRKTIDKATERKAKRNKGALYAGKPATDKDPVMAEGKHYNSFEEFQRGI